MSEDTAKQSDIPTRSYERRAENRMVSWMAAIIGALLTLGLSGLCGWISSINGRVISLETRGAVIEVKLDQINQTLKERLK
jgi:hypothetical protein